jgi:hypothetical protein
MCTHSCREADFLHRWFLIPGGGVFGGFLASPESYITRAAARPFANGRSAISYHGGAGIVTYQGTVLNNSLSSNEDSVRRRRFLRCRMNWRREGCFDWLPPFGSRRESGPLAAPLLSRHGAVCRAWFASGAERWYSLVKAPHPPFSRVHDPSDQGRKEKIS